MFLRICIKFLILIIKLVTTKKECGYKSCNVGNSRLLNVHIVPHTHDDLGWLNTVDQYYDGISNGNNIAGVRDILDSVVMSLLKDKQRKFSYVEMAYFYMWWIEQSQNVKKKVKMLVNEGRLQFISGGWTMNDEATTHYTAIIDQMSLGLDFLNQTFGKCGLPLVGWQIDTFGHSMEQANLLAEFGFDGWFFTRLHYLDLQERRLTKEMEFIQQTSYFNAKISKTLFTSILYDTYFQPLGLCFEEICNMKIVNSDSPESNVEFFADTLMTFIEKYNKTYATNHILIPLGGDFQYQNAIVNFLSIDELIKFTNEKYGNSVKIFYSTPSCYLYAVNQADLKKQYTLHNTDFFPYATNKNQYWSGYFSSRPTVKGFVRKSNNIFQICKKLYALSGLNDRKLNKLVTQMAMEIGIMQHHDAITGTHKQHVTYDYMKRLSHAINGCELVIKESYYKLLSKYTFQYGLNFCKLLNISICRNTEQFNINEQLKIIIFNPLEYSVESWIRLPIVMTDNNYFNIFNSNNEELKFELIPIQNRTLNIPEKLYNSKANYELVLKTLVPGMGYSSYKIFQKSEDKRKLNSFRKVNNKKHLLVENSKFQLTYIGGLLLSIKNKVNNISLKVSQSIRSYTSVKESTFAGIYAFDPQTFEASKLSEEIEIQFYNGSLVQEVHQTFSNYATLVTRLFQNSDLIETEWTIGPLQNEIVSNDVIIHFSLGLDNSATFYTDSNGRQLIKRNIKDLPNSKTEFTNPAENYYPIDASALLFDSKIDVGFLIHTERAQGGGAMRTGEFELMVHRRIFNNDNLGIDEFLNEPGYNNTGLIARGRHWFTIDTVENIFKRRRHEALEIFNEPQILFSTSSHYLNADPLIISDYSSINLNAIPKGLHILSFENHITTDNEVDYKILRLENILHVNTQPLKVDVRFIFKNFKILKYEELNLSTNQLLKDVHRLKWNQVMESYKIPKTHPDEDGFIIVKPNEIKTFRIFIK